MFKKMILTHSDFFTACDCEPDGTVDEGVCDSRTGNFCNFYALSYKIELKHSQDSGIYQKYPLNNQSDGQFNFTYCKRERVDIQIGF